MRISLNARTFITIGILSFGLTLSGYIGWLTAEVQFLREHINSLAKINREAEARSSRKIQIIESRVVREASRLDEFQRWRITITLASRKGWGAANRYIARQWEFMPEEWRYAERDKNTDR